MGTPPQLNLGAWRELDGTGGGVPLLLPAKHLVTHGVVVGMTGSGKTGLLMVMIEEALRNKVPTLVIDVKGDLPNLLLAFPSFDSAPLEPWVEHTDDGASSEARAASARALADERRAALTDWSIGERELAEYCASTDVRVVTPGVEAGELLHVLSPLERRSPQWSTDPDSARQSLSAAVSLVLRLLDRNPDPASSREHVLLALLAERRLLAGENAEIGALMRDVVEPPLAEIGALPVNSFLRKKERNNLAAALNTLLASPTFASWRRGTDMNPGAWLTPRDGRTPAVVVSVAHLDDEERALVLGLLLEETLSWVRSLRGSSRLRALIVFDEIYGFLPPYPANPPTKRPLVSLMKQARAFGVGVVVATQNPMDLDYRALSNAGLWALGRLQTDADRERVIDGISNSESGANAASLDGTLKRLGQRWFVVQNAHASGGPILMKPRHAMSLMRGPMTRGEIRAGVEHRRGLHGAHGVSRAGAS
jgi:hypothetical protein